MEKRLGGLLLAVVAALGLMAFRKQTPPRGAGNLQISRKEARAARCLSNAKQIALGVLMYTQDFDDRTPSKSAGFTELIFPYTRNRDLYTCPSAPDKTISYSLNSGIAGVRLRTVKSPAKTVMIYEGKAGQLDFRHDGRAAIGFADGHCKWVREEEVASLIWTVKASPKDDSPKKKTHR